MNPDCFNSISWEILLGLAGLRAEVGRGALVGIIDINRVGEIWGEGGWELVDF